MKYANILKPGNIGNLELKNRIIFNPCETSLATVQGEATQQLIDFYTRRAEGGTALLVVHPAQACTRLDPYDPFPHSLRIDDNAYIPRLGELTEAVHQAGAKVALLVSAGGGAQSGGFPYERGMEGIQDIELVGPSEKQSQVAMRKVRKLSIDEIHKIIDCFGLAARRVKQAGFDALYIHAFAGYLTSEFMSPYFNTRDDEYGGNFDRRIKFLLEQVESCRNNVGSDYPIVVRMSIDEYVPGGRNVEESIRIAKRLEEVGVNGIDAGAGIYESMQMIVPPCYLPKGVHVDLAATVKREVKIPVVTQGRIYDPDLAESIIQTGKADFVGMVRGLIADPYWVDKIVSGKAGEIRKCIACNYCTGRIGDCLTIRCAQNATVGREGKYPEVPPLAPEKKKVIVVGAGPGGMEAARITAQRGHDVKIFERTGELGGQLKSAAKPPYREELLNIIEYQTSQFEKLDNLEIALNQEVTANEIVKENPDIVIIATGAVPSIPNIPGIDDDRVVQAVDVLTGKVQPKGKVVVTGGGLVGTETAHTLSEQGVKDIIIVTRLDMDSLAGDEEAITRLTLLALLQDKGVKIATGKILEEINKDGVVVTDKDSNKTTIPADYIILARGFVPNNLLETELTTRIKKYQIIGDAQEPRRIVNAVSEGFLAGYQA